MSPSGRRTVPAVGCASVRRRHPAVIPSRGKNNRDACDRYGHGHDGGRDQSGSAHRARPERGCARGRAAGTGHSANDEPLQGGEREQRRHHAQQAPLPAQLVAEHAAARAIAEVTAQRRPPKRGPTQCGQLLADLRARSFAGAAAGLERRSGLVGQRLDLLATTSQTLRDLVVGDVAQLGEHERGALVVRQPRQIGQHGTELVTHADRGGHVIDRGLGLILYGPHPAGAQQRQAAMASDPIQPRAKGARTLAARDLRPRDQERLLHDVLGVLARAQHPAAELEQRPSVALEQLLEGTPGALLDLLNQTPIGDQRQRCNRSERPVLDQCAVRAHVRAASRIAPLESSPR
jgi:hypothetical protein